MSNNVRTQLAKAFLAELKTRFIIFHTHFPLEIGIDKELESLFPQVPKPVIKEAISRAVTTPKVAKEAKEIVSSNESA